MPVTLDDWFAGEPSTLSQLAAMRAGDEEVCEVRAFCMASKREVGCCPGPRGAGGLSWAAAAGVRTLCWLEGDSGCFTTGSAGAAAIALGAAMAARAAVGGSGWPPSTAAMPTGW